MQVHSNYQGLIWTHDTVDFAARVAPINASSKAKHADGQDDNRSQQNAEEHSTQDDLSSKENNENKELRELRELRERDAEVRRHEQAHAAAGGSYAGSPSFEYERGSDGRLYAVGGHVQIDTSAIPNDPEATERKLQQVRRAALAPADPSAEDRKVAAEASTKLAKARVEARQKNGITNGTESSNREGESAEVRNTEHTQGKPNLSAGLDSYRLANESSTGHLFQGLG